MRDLTATLAVEKHLLNPYIFNGIEWFSKDSKCTILILLDWFDFQLF